MRAVRSLGVGAAALDDRANTPRLNHTARLLERRGCLLSLTIRLLIKRTARPLERPASVFNARFTNRGTVHSAGIKPRTLDETLAPFWSAFPYVAPTLAGIVAGAAMVRVHQDVRADTAARRAIHARERQLDVLMNLVRHLIIELSTKNLLKICPLKLNRLGLIYGIPRNIDRVGARLPRGHKRAEPDLSRLIRKRPSDNIVYTSGSVRTAVKMTDSPAVIFDTFVCKLRNTGAPSMGADVKSSPVGVDSLESLDSPDPVTVSPLGFVLAAMVPDIEAMLVAVD